MSTFEKNETERIYRDCSIGWEAEDAETNAPIFQLQIKGAVSSLKPTFYCNITLSKWVYNIIMRCLASEV